MLKNIGNTPMIKIEYKYKGKTNFIYSKLEYYNLTGSIKDRVAYYIIQNAKKSGRLMDKSTIVEATSGNTGISLAALGAYFRTSSSYFYAWLGKPWENKNYAKLWSRSNTYFKTARWI